MAAVVPVVVTFAEPLPLAVPAAMVIVLPPAVEQVGRLAAAVGLVVSAQVSVMVPLYPVFEVAVIVEVAVPPLLITAGVVAASANAGPVTVTVAEPAPIE